MKPKKTRITEKVYDRNRMKRAAIKSDDGSHFFCNL